jgi:hypothetical protein
MRRQLVAFAKPKMAKATIAARKPSAPGVVLAYKPIVRRALPSRAVKVAGRTRHAVAAAR